jgi:hypothetical protein
MLLCAGALSQMEKELQFKAGVRHCEAKPVISGHLARIGNTRMLVNIKHTPHLLVAKVVVLFCFRPLVCSTLQVTRPGDESERHSSWPINVNLNARVLAPTAKALNVLHFGHFALADHQYSRSRLKRRSLSGGLATSVSESHLLALGRD